MQDRIKQMAEEAGFDLDPHGGIARAYESNLARFAQIVAEDCAKVAEERHAKEKLATLANEGWNKYELIAFESCAIAIDLEIRARYGIKE